MLKKKIRKYKTYFKFKYSNKRLKPMHLIILCCAIIFFTFGFSLLSTQVGLSGTVGFIAPQPVLATSNNLF